MAVGDTKTEGLPGLEGISLSDVERRRVLDSEPNRLARSQEETGTGFIPGMEDFIRFPDGGVEAIDPLKWLLRQESTELGEVREEGVRTMHWAAGYRPSVEEARLMDAMGFLRAPDDPLTGEAGQSYYPLDKDVIDQVISTPWDKAKAASWGLSAGTLFGFPVTLGALEAIAEEFGTWARVGIEGNYRYVTDNEDFRQALADKAESRGLTFYELTQDVSNKHLIKEVLDENYKMPWGVAGAMEMSGYAAMPLTAGEALVLKAGFSFLKGSYRASAAAYRLVDPGSTVRGLANNVPAVPGFVNKLSNKVFETRSRNLQVHDVSGPQGLVDSAGGVQSVEQLEARLVNVERQLKSQRPDEFSEYYDLTADDPFADYKIPEGTFDGAMERLSIEQSDLYRAINKVRAEGGDTRSFEVWSSEGEPLLSVTAKKTAPDEPVFEMVGGVPRELPTGTGFELEVQALKRFDTPEAGQGLKGAGFDDLGMKGSFSRKEILEVAEVVGEMLDTDVLHGVRIPDEAFGGAGKGVRFQKVDIPDLKRVLDRGNPVDAHTSELVKEGRVELFKDAYNPVVEGIEGVPDGALRWNDLSFWYRMADDVDIRGIRNELDHAGRKVMVDVFQRLEALGLVSEVRPGVYRRIVENGSVRANEILGELARFHKGVVGGGADSGPRWVASLGSFESAVLRVDAVENKVLRGFLTKSGINPSVGALSSLEKMVIAFVRQTNVSEELSEVAIQAAYDSHRVRWKPFGKGPGLSFGSSPVKMDTAGMIDVSGKKVHWNDVFADPDSFGDAFRPGTGARNLIDDYQKAVKQMEELRLVTGLPKRPVLKTGLVYIPRIGIGDARGDFIPPVDPYHLRVWETATAGAVEGGVRYEADPRAVLELHLRSSYHDILMKNMENYVITSDLGTTYDAALRSVVPDVMARWKQRFAIFKSLEDELIKMRIRNNALAANVGDDALEVQNAAKRIADQQKRVIEARRLFDAEEYKKGHALNQIKQGKRVDSGLFSLGETGEELSVAEFMGIFMRKEDVEVLRGGIKHLMGPSAGWLRTANKIAGTIKYTSATLDLAAPFTHGLMMLPTNPRRWAKAAWHSTWALMDPTVQSHFIKDNLSVIQRMARAGVPIGDVEYFAAARPGGGIAWGAPLGKVKAGPINGEYLRKLANGVVGNTLGRFQAAYNADVLIMRTELWKALEPYFYNQRRRGGDAELASTVTNITGGIDIKALGVGPNQRAIEGILMAFAPRLMRSIATIFSDAFRAIPTETGFRVGFREEGATAKQMQALRSLTGVVTFMHGFTGTLWAANEYSKSMGDSNYTVDWRRGYTELFNPLSGRRYMSIEKDGEWYGIGGQTRGMLQFLTGLVMALNPFDESDKTLVSWDSQKNPALQRWVTLGAPGLDAAQAILEATTGADLVPGENLEGVWDVVRHIGSNALMFAIQGKLEGDNVGGVIGSSVGFNTKPTTPFENAMKLRRDVFEGMSLEEKGKFRDSKGEFLIMWPGTTHGDAWENMDLRLKDYIDGKDPDIGVFLDAHRQKRLKAGDNDQEYFAARDVIIEDRNSAIDGLETKYGVGKEFRERMSDVYTDAKGHLAQLDVDYEDVVKGLEVSDRKGESEYNRAELKFWQQMSSPDLVDSETGEYLYFVDKSVREDLADDPLVGPHLEAIELRLNTMHPVGARVFWGDMEIMKPYHLAGEEVAESSGRLEEYRNWLREDKDDRERMQDEDPRLRALVVDGGAIQVRKQRMRTNAYAAYDWTAEQALRLEAALLKWQYVETPMNNRLRYLWNKMKVSQGGWIQDRGGIDRLVDEYLESQVEMVAP